MKTSKDMREGAERYIRLARQSIDDSVASALLAYAGELEQRAQLVEKSFPRNTAAANLRTVNMRTAHAA